ncbi:hypothetical protein LAZ67_6001698 [Cordylochernes scorpioides]|uniref:Sulfotransferase domain-containing protein n=1 Tax=Cordylochernes scorpioides TaxID=51811 RepID=A0ABY6KKC7_9ARAC|nr:hypothetical protein LAZ67_6001698 [Cordylochernes scorpioides]
MDKYIATIKEVEGIKIPLFFEDAKFLSSMHYQPKSDDIVIASFPKSGTNWLHYTIYLIWSKGEPCKSFEEFQKTGIFMDKLGSEEVAKLSTPKLIKTHIPFEKLNYSKEAKYIYMARNPKDCAVSYYHHVCHRSGVSFDFKDFFDCYYKGELTYGDQILHLKEWNDNRNHPNVLFMTYEEMKEDQKTAILKIAKFLFGDLEKELQENQEIMDKIIKYSSVEECRKIIQIEKLIQHQDKEGFIKKDEGTSNKKVPDFKFVRKGIVGDWKNNLSKEQSDLLDEKAEKYLAGTDIYAYWKKLGIF